MKAQEIARETIIKDAAWISMTPEQRRDAIAGDNSIAMASTNAQIRYESGYLSDEAVKSQMYKPRYEAAIKYMEAQK